MKFDKSWKQFWNDLVLKQIFAILYFFFWVLRLLFYLHIYTVDCKPFGNRRLENNLMHFINNWNYTRRNAIRPKKCSLIALFFVCFWAQLTCWPFKYFHYFYLFWEVTSFFRFSAATASKALPNSILFDSFGNSYESIQHLILHLGINL